MSAFRTVPWGAVCLLCAAASVAAPRAQPPSGTPMRPVASVADGTPPALTEAVARIWAQSPEVQAARAELDAARARSRAASQPLYNPSLTLEGENADVDRRTAGLSLALDLSGKRRARAREGEALLRASEAAYNLRRRDLAARWLKAWSAAALASRQSELGQRRVLLMQRFDTLAAQRLKVGDISSPERDLAGLALGEAQLQQASLVGEEAAARATLRSIEGTAVAPLPSLPPALPPPAVASEAVPSHDLPELVQARAEQAAAEAAVQVARRARIPDPTLSLTGGRVRSGARSDRVIGVSVSIPLPVRNSGSAEVTAALADADAAVSRVRALQLALDARGAETASRYAALRDAAVAFRSGRAGAFDERTALLEKLWRAGEISTSDYLVQLKQSLDTALSGLELESRAWQAWFDYLTAAGRLTDWVDGRSEDASR